MRSIGSLSQEAAQQLDQELMGDSVRYSVDQLMELAGLAVAQCIEDAYHQPNHKAVLVVCGPGNNGGDGLVAARHLRQMGYHVSVCYPKKGRAELFARLVSQLEFHEVEVRDTMTKADLEATEVIVDAIFGFSFIGQPRAPFDAILQMISEEKKIRGSMVIVSVDVPSGWDVDEGDNRGKGLAPDCLISLTFPKRCAEQFVGRHYVAGRFVPSKLQYRLPMRIPYSGHNQFLLLSDH